MSDRSGVGAGFWSSGLAGRWWLLALWSLPVLGVIWTAYQAPAWLEPRLLSVELAPGQSLVLGRDALWASQADREHIELRRDGGAGWRLTNLSAAKQVRWRSNFGHYDARSVRSWPLAAGASFAVGTETFAVLNAEPERLILQGGGLRWDYDGLNLRRDGRLLPPCHADWRARWRARLEKLGWSLVLTRRPLRLGGGVYCADRLGLAGVPLDTVVIEPTPTGFALDPGAAGRRDGTLVTVAVGTPEAESLWERSIPLGVGDRLTVGRTRYEVMQAAPVLELAVVAGARRWLADSPPPAASGVRVEWGRLAWLWPSGSPAPAGWLGLLLSALVPGSLWWAAREWRWRSQAGNRWLRIALGLALAGTCLEMHWNVATLPLLWPYLLAWPVLLVWLGTVRSPWSVGLLAVVTLLLGSGLLALLQLGIGSGEAGWLRYGGSGAALAGAFGGLAWVGQSGWQLIRPAGWPGERRLWWGLRLLGAVSLALLAAQVIAGDEGGWAGFQPFELTKLVLAAAAAHALALRGQSPLHGWSYDKAAPWLRYLGPLLLLAVASGFALLYLHDFSPLLLLLCWGVVLAWAYLRTHPLPWWRWSGLLLLGALVLLLAAGLRGLHDRPDALPLDFQAERIRAWAAPEFYPHAGYQLRRALEAIRAGGWQGTVWREAVNGRVMTVPVVESDFAPTFFLNRYGGLAGLMLVGIQAVFIGLLLMIANRALRRLGTGRSWPAALGGFFYFTLSGSAALLAAHFLMSWGTNLGFLPVMGQPMPLLSAAGSHLVLFVLPIVALAVAIEERSHDDPL
ncbi:MAG: FtsW/RodA/SpoVE family cell cycle protein [Candidatus Competibacteraceae bacterium]|nr:FtsW/RodA/SpoVE family cell cycle protein [Candidatus Competibacteraceae bacterium]MBK7982676.1 FtsW/RodA/SpoVE family cell cycle protein [Candidatus Competibacteraceae bacterium]MBK8962574.1 FtsW/RodA/SpoVE family cell cycle protein [Candidatus Competibacteraceae bacterium]